MNTPRVTLPAPAWRLPIAGGVRECDGDLIANAYSEPQMRAEVERSQVLLAACEAVEQAQRDGDYAAAFAAVRSAIAKAKGEQP